MKQKRATRTGMKSVIAMTALLLTSATLASCGKTGMPQPQDPDKSFTIKEVSARPVGDCLSIQAAFDGAYENFERLRLEIESINGPEDCPGCPFVPDEVIMFSHNEVGFNVNDGSLAFSYCPHKADTYRWRVLGISKFSSVPHAVSHEIYTEMKLQPEKKQKKKEPSRENQMKQTITIFE